MPDQSDADLVRQCLEGDTAVFGLLIDRYQKPVFNTALRISGDPEEAKDITQTAFVKAYENLRSYRPEHRFFSWIYRIMMNESINRFKQRRHVSADELRIESHENNPEEMLEANELGRCMERALRQLAFDYRLVIVLRYFNDMSYAEMSDVLSIPAKTVKSRLYSARQNLAVILGRMGMVSP